MKQEYYFSTDVETNGPIPGEYSMLSMGTAVFNQEGEILGRFSANFKTLPNAKEHPDTMEWWKTQKEAWVVCRENTESAEVIMPRYVKWVKQFDCLPTFIGFPIGFDFMFVYWYLMKFAGESPFSFSALDIKSYASAIMKKDYRKSTKRNMPHRWFTNSPHTHKAIDDAIEQGELFMNMRRENLKI